MHTFLTRLNALFAFVITVVGFLGAGLYLTTFLYPQNGIVKLDTSNVVVKSAIEVTNNRKKNDLGLFYFDLNVDLSHLYNWNCKQLFLYLTAEYQTKNNKLNQVVIWDKIILKGENYKLNLKNQRPKYGLWDDGDYLRNHNNVTMFLSWNIVPNVGALPLIQSDGIYKFGFPSTYSS